MNRKFIRPQARNDPNAARVKFLVNGCKTQKKSTSTAISIPVDELHEVLCLIFNLCNSLNKFNNLTCVA